MAKQSTKPFSNGHPHQTVSLICEGTVIKGDISTTGDIRIDGTVDGNITAKGRLVIGPKGKITGEIHSGNIEVSGYIKGKTKAIDIFNMKSSAKVFGDITVGKLAVEPGSVYIGNCNMGGEKPAYETPAETK